MALKHGTLSRYNSGYRCGDCVYRNSSYRQQDALASRQRT